MLCTFHRFCSCHWLKWKYWNRLLNRFVLNLIFISSVATRGKVGPEAVFLFRNEIIHCSLEHGFHVLEKKNRHLKGFRCQRRSCCASVDALFRICWSGFFSESSKSFYSQKVNVQCMCTLYMYSSYVSATCKAIKILCVFKGLVINNFFSTNLFMPLPLIWVYLCAPGFHYFSVWIYWHQANKPTPNAAQSKWFFEKFICSFLNFNYVKVKEKIPMLTSPFFEAQTMQYSSP